MKNCHFINRSKNILHLILCFFLFRLNKQSEYNMPSKKDRSKAQKKSKASLKGETPERYEKDSEKTKHVMNVCTAHIWVQKALKRPFGKINMLVIRDEGDDWLYGDQTEEGFSMMKNKLRGLEVEYPNMCLNWWELFVYQMKSSPKYSLERGIQDDARFFFCCCVRDEGEEKSGWRMDRGNYVCFYDTQENPIV